MSRFPMTREQAQFAAFQRWLILFALTVIVWGLKDIRNAIVQQNVVQEVVVPLEPSPSYGYEEPSAEERASRS